MALTLWFSCAIRNDFKIFIASIYHDCTKISDAFFRLDGITISKHQAMTLLHVPLCFGTMSSGPPGGNTN